MLQQPSSSLSSASHGREESTLQKLRLPLHALGSWRVELEAVGSRGRSPALS